MTDPKTKLVAIIGPTASGKTDLALRLAEEMNGEIICADSRTIYRGMDIGTAKPTVADQARVPHHLLDIVTPDETFSAQQFKLAAKAIIAEIASRGRVPFLVGGTGLYVYSVVYDFQFPAGPRTAERQELESRPLSELVEELRRKDPKRAGQIDLRNPRRVIRALETVGQHQERVLILPPQVLLLGLRPSEEALNTNIAQRVQHMFQIGLVAEVQDITAQYGPYLEVLKSPGYAEVVSYLRDEISLAEAQELIRLHTRQLVKRQLTWFRRNPEIKWVETTEQAELTVREFLA